MGATNIFTYTLSSGSLNIASSDNVQRLSVICRQGNISFIGNATFKGIASDAITLEENQGITLTSSATSNPLDGITVTSASGSDIAEIIVSTS